MILIPICSLKDFFFLNWAFTVNIQTVEFIRPKVFSFHNQVYNRKHVIIIFCLSKAGKLKAL
jgi:hypothetical protein